MDWLLGNDYAYIFWFNQLKCSICCYSLSTVYTMIHVLCTHACLLWRLHCHTWTLYAVHVRHTVWFVRCTCCCTRMGMASSRKCLAIVISRILYALLVWGGFLSSHSQNTAMSCLVPLCIGSRLVGCTVHWTNSRSFKLTQAVWWGQLAAKIDAPFKCIKCLCYLDHLVTITDLVSNSDYDILGKKTTQRCLHHLLPLLVVLITFTTVVTHTSLPVIAVSSIKTLSNLCYI